jgi:3-deoxy-D-manno-octulosonic acid (KDO) 8-phosphate synthase
LNNALSDGTKMVALHRLGTLLHPLLAIYATTADDHAVSSF